MKKDFTLGAGAVAAGEIIGNHIVIIPDNMTLLNAMKHAREKAVERQNGVEFEAAGFNFFIGTDEIPSIERSLAAGRRSNRDIVRHIMMDIMAEMPLTLPLPSDKPESMYPFTSAALHEILNTPLCLTDHAAMEDKLTALQKEYCDYLLATLERSAQDKNHEAFDACWTRIEAGILENSYVSQIWLFDQQKHELSRILKLHGKMTSPLEALISKAGTGEPCPHQTNKWEQAIEQAQKEFRLVCPTPGLIQ